MFFLIVIVVMTMMYGYVGWRIIVPAALSTPLNAVAWFLVAALLVLPFIPIAARLNGISGSGIDVVSWIAYLSFGFITLLFALLVGKDLVFIVVTVGQKAVHFVGGLFNAGLATADAVDPERRQLLTNSINLGLLGLTGALTGYGMFEALRAPKIVRLAIPIEHLPEDLNGFTIVQITDLHVSSTIKRPFIQQVVDTVNGLKPDLIALTGDLPDGSVDELRNDVAPLAELKAPHGLYFITGNHEYYSGVLAWLQETARLGFDVLVNEHRIIERGKSRLLLAGVTDLSGGQFLSSHVSDPHKAIAGAPQCDAKILLAHQPKSIFEAAKAGFDYVISGHTHGGQYLPYHFLAALAQPYIAGMHEYERTKIYVSRGTGYWGPPLRIGARSEITVHKLVTA